MLYVGWMAWIVDWSHPKKQGKYWARNTSCHMKNNRDWHYVCSTTLHRVGIKTPLYRKDSWEIDWKKRNGKLVWGRNVCSKMPSARGWHWIDFHTVENAGFDWKPVTEKKGRYIDGCGYVNLTPAGMTTEEVAMADRSGLWMGKKRSRCLEHRLVAIKKFGSIPPGNVVRHLNGCKTDNSVDNIVTGTTKENSMDHATATRLAMYWRNKYEDLLKEVKSQGSPAIQKSK